MIVLLAYLSGILRKNLNVLVYAKMVKSGIYHDIRTMILTLNHPTCIALPCFYAFLGCDTVSSFYSKGKCRGWDVWMQNRSDFDEIFICLGNSPSDVTEADMNVTESLRYEDIHKFANLRKLPPSRRALEQHPRRACYQAGYVWQESVGDLTLPNPENWRWVFEGNMYQPR